MASAASILLLTACRKEELRTNEADEGLDFRAAPASISITTAWEAGATTLLGSPAHAAQNNTVMVANDAVTGRVIFRRWDNQIIGRTNGAGNDGVASRAFFYKVNTWTAKIPFAFGITTGTNNGREAIWTPQFVTSGIAGVHMGLFATDNNTGDEDPTVGTIKVGNWRVVQLTVLDNNGVDIRKRCSIEERVGSNWVQRVRTNNNNGIVELRAFTVLNVRTGYSITGGVVGAPTTTAIPVLKSQLVGINNSTINGPIIFWTLQKGGQVAFNDEMYRF